MANEEESLMATPQGAEPASAAADTSAAKPDTNNEEAASPVHRSKKERRRSRTLRYVTVLGVLAIYIVGVVLNTGLGSLCAFGVDSIAAICPVGILETAIADRIFLPLPVIVLLVIIVLSVIFGRSFCGWVCPVPLTRKAITGKGEAAVWEKERNHRNTNLGCASCDGSSCAKIDIDQKQGSKKITPLSKNSKTALGVLAITLITTLIFGFPVFCLVCPVGLVFATIFAVIRLVAFNELVVDLLIFPALIIIELVVLRKWCATLCPIGAFLGLLSRFGKTFRPTVNTDVCLATSKGSSCDACHQACGFDIDLVRATGTGNIADCTRCKECAAHCPVDAITFPAVRPSA